MNSPFFCDLGALSPQQRKRHGELAKMLRPLVVELRELTDGYVAVLRSSQDIEAAIAEFLTLEKQCCPFFELDYRIDSRDREARMYQVKITGPGDIKPFIRTEFGFSDNDHIV